MGRRFGLDEATADDLVVGNVLGLMSVRLADDLLDGEVPTDDPIVAGALADRLLALGMERFRRHLPTDSAFWPYVESCLGAWRAAGDSDRPADRGAPLGIAAFAVCLLTAQTTLWPIIEAAIDHAVAGLVLYDDLADWRADLLAGRRNAFVAALSDQPQQPAFQEHNRRAVLVGMLAGNGVSSYCSRILREFEAGSALAAEVGLLPLAQHLRDLVAEVEESASALQRHYREAADRAAGLLLRSAIPVAR
jgi:hypothetical protein